MNGMYNFATYSVPINVPMLDSYIVPGTGSYVALPLVRVSPA